MTEDLQRNDIPAENQNCGAYFVFKKGNGIRVLFVGNSIAKHSVKPEVGWHNDCGMAASCEDKDYIHLMMKKINEYHPDAAVSLLQVAGFERSFSTFDYANNYKIAQNFGADVIVMFFGANVPKEYDATENPEITFSQKYQELRNFLNKDNEAFVVHSEGFYLRPVINQNKIKAAERCGDIWVSLGDIPTREDTHGRFNHPNDKGMAEIADRLWAAIEEYVKDFRK